MTRPEVAAAYARGGAAEVVAAVSARPPAERGGLLGALAHELVAREDWDGAAVVLAEDCTFGKPWAGDQLRAEVDAMRLLLHGESDGERVALVGARARTAYDLAREEGATQEELAGLAHTIALALLLEGRPDAAAVSCRHHVQFVVGPFGQSVLLATEGLARSRSGERSVASDRLREALERGRPSIATVLAHELGAPERLAPAAVHRVRVRAETRNALVRALSLAVVALYVSMGQYLPWLSLAAVLLCAAVAVLAHETGHAAAVVLVGGRVTSFRVGSGPRLTPAGWWLDLRALPFDGKVRWTGARSLGRWSLVTVAGVAVNIGLAVGAGFVWSHPWAVWQTAFVVVNGYYAVVNALPTRKPEPTDGARILARLRRAGPAVVGE